MKYILSLIVSGALVVSGFGQTRNVLVGTNNAVVQPTNFWSADASNARTGLGLGSAATNSASSFQPSSATLSNLATSNGGLLTNIQASNIVGSIAASNIPAVTFTGISGTLSVTQGGTGATNASDARQNLGSTTVGDAVFVATNSASARTALGATTIGGNIFTAVDASAVRTLLSLGTSATNPATAFQPASTNLTLLASGDGSSLTNLNLSGLGAINISNISGLQSALDGKLATNGTAPLAINVTGTVAIANGGTGGTNAETARSGLGATTIGSGIFTLANPSAIRFLRLNADNTVSTLSDSDFRTAIGLGTAATNAASVFQPSSSALTNLASNDGGSLTNIQASNLVGTVAVSNIPTVTLTNISGVLAVSKGGTGATNVSDARTALGGTTVGNAVFTATNAEAARTALSLGTAATSAVTAFQPANANLTNLSTNNGASLTGIPISGVVNLQSNLDTKLATNGNANGLTNITAANITGTVALASNITGTAALATNVTGVVAIANGGTGTNSASGARTSLGATTVGANLFTLPNPDDTRFIRLNANNTVSALSAADMRTALSVGTNLGTVTSVGLTVPSFLSVSTPTITSSGTFAITLGNQTSRNVFVAPNGGGIPAFRALESDDLPSLAISKITDLQTALDGKLSTTGTAPLATNVTGVVALANGGTGGTNATSARSGLGATTVGENIFTIPNPSAVRFLRFNADNTVSVLSDSDFRTALSLGTAATNAASAFQPADSDLNALAANNGGNLTNLTAANISGTVALASNITGTVAIANGGTGSTTASGARTALGASTVGGNLFTLVNPSAIRFLRLNADNTATALSASDFRTAIGLSTAATNAESAFQPSSLSLSNLSANNGGGLTNLNATNVVGTLGVAQGGTGSTNASDARTALGLGTAATNPATAFQPASTNLTALAGNNGVNLTNIPVAGVVGALVTNGNGAGLTNLTAANITGSVAIANGGTGATNAATARTNLGLGWSALTNTDATSFRNAIGLGTTNTVTFGQIALGSDLVIGDTTTTWGGNNRINYEELKLQGGNWKIDDGSLVIGAGTNQSLYQAQTRTNLGIPWTALTNTNAATFQSALFGANTNPVLVDTNGEVVSPTNFWQAAPITTTFIESQPTTNSTTNITAARFLHIHSFNTNIINVTNTIALPTNGSTYNGDIALVIHQGPTSSMTRVRTVGSTNDLITMTRFDEAVEFVYYNGVWEFNHNKSFIEPIYFSGTNASNNIAQSRTNLGLGNASSVTFLNLFIEDGAIYVESGTNTYFYAGDDLVEIFTPVNIYANNGIYFDTNNNSAANTRTNLGIPLPALTNTTVTNFQKAIFYTNTAPSNIGGNLGTIAAWIEIVASNGVTYKIPAYTNVP